LAQFLWGEIASATKWRLDWLVSRAAAGGNGILFAIERAAAPQLLWCPPGATHAWRRRVPIALNSWNQLTARTSAQSKIRNRLIGDLDPVEAEMDPLADLYSAAR